MKLVVLNGFVKIHRKLIQWGWYQDNVVKGVFLHLLLTASFRDAPWQGRTIKAGQVVTSYERLAEDLGFGVQRVRTAIKKLKSTGEITTETTNKYTLVTVVNWEDYQCFDDNATGKSTSTSTNNQQTTNKQKQADSVNKLLTTLDNLQKVTSKSTNKKEAETLIGSAIEGIKKEILTSTLTINQQTTNKQLTNNQQHRKNVKNVKNVKNKRSGESAADFTSFLNSVAEGEIEL